MTAAGWLQLAALIVFIVVGTRLLGPYIAGVYSPASTSRRPSARSATGSSVPSSGSSTASCGVDEKREQRWSVYALSLLAFSLVSVLVVYAFQRLQGSLPVNPNGLERRARRRSSFNTAVSFVTNTNWQNYTGESTMSHLTQMAALAVQNFVSAAVGLCVVDRPDPGPRPPPQRHHRQLLGRPRARHRPPPAAARLRLRHRLRQPGRGAEPARQHRRSPPSRASTQVIPGGPVASQEAIKELGTNGGGFFNANSAHPFENPNGFTNWLQMATHPAHPLRPHLRLRAHGQGPEAGLGRLRRHVRALDRGRRPWPWAWRPTATPSSRAGAPTSR